MTEQKPQRTNDRGIGLIKSFESFSPQSYICPAGKPTIGYGHVIGPGENFAEPISEKEASRILAADVRKAERSVLWLVDVPLTDNQFSALASFVFNVGAQAFRTSTMRQYLNQGAFSRAAAEFDRWVYANKKKLSGLVRRRAAEKALFLRH